MQGQIGQQVRDVTFVAQQPQVRRVDHRLHQAAHHQLGQTITDAHCKAHGRRTDRIAHELRQLRTQREDLLGPLHGGRTRLGQHQPAPRRLQQGVAERALQLTHLGAHGLHGHAEPIGRAGDAAFGADDPEIVEMAVAEAQAHGQFFRNCRFFIVCF